MLADGTVDPLYAKDKKHIFNRQMLEEIVSTMQNRDSFNEDKTKSEQSRHSIPGC